MGNACRMLGETLKRKEYPGGPDVDWGAGGHVKLDLKATGCVGAMDWVQLAEHKRKQKLLVKTAINHRFRHMEFLYERNKYQLLKNNSTQ
jgi:hypothetical protein